MLTLDLFSAVIRNFIISTSGPKEVLCGDVVPVNILRDLGKRNDGVQIIVGLYDCLLLRSTTTIKTEKVSASEILNSDIRAVGVSQRRIDRILSLREVRRIVLDSVSNYPSDQESCAKEARISHEHRS